MSIWEPAQDVRITVPAKTGKEKDHRLVVFFFGERIYSLNT